MRPWKSQTSALVTLLIVAAVKAQPQLTSFSITLTPPEQLTLTFTTSVNASSCDIQELTLQNASMVVNGGAYTPQMGNCSHSERTNIVEIRLSGSDWAAIQGNIYLATSIPNTFLSMGSNFISDVSTVYNVPISPSSALQVSAFVPNMNPPSVLSGTLDLDSGTLEIVLSEGILVNQLNATGFSVNFSAVMNTVALSGALSVSAVTYNSRVAIFLLRDDLNYFKINGSLPFTLSVEAGSFADANGVENAAQSGILANFVPDTTRPQFNEFWFDLNSSSATFFFDEPIAVSSINFDDIFVTGMLQNSLGGYALSSSNISSVENTSTLILIILTTTVINSIKADQQVCTRRSDCLLFLTNSSITDTSGNLLLPPFAGILPSLFTADTTPPQLSSFNLDLDTGNMFLTFSEPMSIGMFDSLGITFLNSPSNQSQQVILSNAMLASVAEFNSVLTLTVGSNTLNQIKLLISNGGTNDIYLSLQSFTISDTTGNSVTPIPISNAVLVSVFTADTTPPVLLGFMPSRPDQRQLVILFDEYIDVSTWNVTHLTLTLTTSQGVITHNTFTQGVITTSDSDNVTYEFSTSEFVPPFSTQYTEAYNRGSIALTATTGLVEDLSGIQSLAVMSPLIFNGTQMDLIRPRLVGFSLNLNSGRLQLTFSEVVQALAVAGNVMLQNSVYIPLHVYTLTNNGSFSQGVTTGQMLDITIATSDLNNIKLNPYLATMIDNTFLVLFETFAQDLSGNQLLEQAATQANTVISDITGPQVLNFDLDLDSNILSLNMSEPVQVSTFDAMRITLTNLSNPSTGVHTMVQLTRIEVIASGNVTSFRVLLGVNDTINIKRQPLCYTVHNCFATFAASLIRDVSNNPSLPSTSPRQVRTLLSDVTPPRLVAFQEFDLDAGVFTLVFSEPVNGSSAAFTDVQFTSARSNPRINVTLSEGFTTPNHIQIDFHMSTSDLNMLKLYPDLCTLRVNCWIRLPSFFISDIDANPFLHSNYEPDAQASFHQPSSFIPDTTPPVLESFSINMTLGALTFSFTEVILETSFDPTNIALLNAPSGGVLLTLSSQSMYMRSSTGTTVEVNLILTDLNWLKARSLYTSRANSYLSLVTNLVDIAGNVFQDIEASNAIQAAAFAPDTAPPKATSFDLFNIDNGSFIITFNEPVDANTVDFHMISLLSTPSGSRRYTLTGGSAQALNTNKLSLLISLSRDDRIQLKLTSGLAVSYTSTYLSLAEGMVLDTAGNTNQAVHAVQLSQSGYVPDTSFASLVRYSLDLNIGVLTLTFDDVINASSVNTTKLTIQSRSQFPAISYTLTVQSAVCTTSSNIIAICIHCQDLHSLQLNLQLATNASNTYISFPPDLANDVEGKRIIEIANNEARAVFNYTQDLTRPTLQSYQLDMNTGQLFFTFSEPILVSSVQPNAIIIQNGSVLTSTLRLTGGALNTSVATSLTALVHINKNDLDLLKSLRNLATEINDTFISFGSSFAQDTNHNIIVPVTSFKVAAFIPDVIQPELLYFDANLRSPVTLTLQFSEAIIFTDMTQSTLVLQNSASNPSNTLTLTGAETITRTSLDQFEVILTPEHTTRLLIDNSIASNVSSFFIAISQGGVSDFSNNPVVTITSTAAQRVRYLFRTCISNSEYNNIVTGTCDPCPNVCVGGCSGTALTAGDGGCNMCATILVDGDNQTCLLANDNCPAGYFSSTNTTLIATLTGLVPNGTVCQSCHSNCFTCTSPDAFSCPACKTAFILKPQNGPVAQCLSSCTGNQSSLCQFCHQQCNGCSGPTNRDCVTCKEDTIVIDGTQACVPRCTGNTYLSQSSDDEHRCHTCDGQCIRCTGPSNSDCTLCRSVNYTVNGTSECIETCPSGTYDFNGFCLPCHEQCHGCNGPTSQNCTMCVGASIQVSAAVMECVPECSLGFGFNSLSQQCELTEEYMLIIIVCSSVGGGLLLILVLIFILCCIYRQCSGKRKTKSFANPVHFIQAKVREDTTAF